MLTKMSKLDHTRSFQKDADHAESSRVLLPEYVCLYIKPQQTEAAVQAALTNPSSAVSDGETHISTNISISRAGGDLTSKYAFI